MNPVTRRLLGEIADPELAAFALAWDEFEENLVRIYRESACPPELEKRHAELRPLLQRHMGRWERVLEPYWRATRIDGAPPERSPFRAVLALRQARAVVENRPLMRILPAAREALNHLLLERGVD
jgi:hypothetical protein